MKGDFGSNPFNHIWKSPKLSHLETGRDWYIFGMLRPKET